MHGALRGGVRVPSRVHIGNTVTLFRGSVHHVSDEFVWQLQRWSVRRSDRLVVECVLGPLHGWLLLRGGVCVCLSRCVSGRDIQLGGGWVLHKLCCWAVRCRVGSHHVIVQWAVSSRPFRECVGKYVAIVQWQLCPGLRVSSGIDVGHADPVSSWHVQSGWH